MGSARPRLLSIPTEIRLQILGFLTREVKSKWRWNYWPLSGNAGIATIHLWGIPTLSVMLTCSCLCKESLAVSNTTGLSVIIDLALDNGCTYITENARDQIINEFVLPRIASATINVAAEPRSRQLYDHMWFNISLLSKALAAQSSNLTTIKVIAKNLTDTPDATSNHSKVFSRVSVPRGFRWLFSSCSGRFSAAGTSGLW